MKYYWAIFCAAVAVAIFLSINPPLQDDTRCLSPINIGCRGGGGIVQKAKIGDGVFLLRVARTEKERSRGLEEVPALANDEGMLFIFPQDDFYAIWMKDMLIPIDIVWLSAGGEVIDMKENISPDTFPSIFTPKSRARFVVELPAGSVKTFAVTIGSRAEFFAK